MATYTTNISWASLKCHNEAVDLLSDSIKYHILLSAAFIHFLMKQTGLHMLSNVGSELRDLTRLVKDKIKRVEETENSAKKIATPATDTLSKVIKKKKGVIFTGWKGTRGEVFVTTT